MSTCVPRESVDGPLHGEVYSLPEDQLVQRVERLKDIPPDDGPPPIFATYYLLGEDGKFYWYKAGEVSRRGTCEECRNGC